MELPLFKKPSNDHCIIMVAFERETIGHSLGEIRYNRKKGVVKADPDKPAELPMALVEQLTLELQEAYDESAIGGFFEVAGIEMGMEFDLEAKSRHDAQRVHELAKSLNAKLRGLTEEQRQEVLETAGENFCHACRSYLPDLPEGKCRCQPDG